MSIHPIPDWLRGQFSHIEDEVHKLGPCGTFTQMRTVTQTYFEQLAESNQEQAVGGEQEVIAIIESALRRSFSLGQIYWQQADSDSTCQQNKSDQTMETQAHHIVMVTDSVRKLFQAQLAKANDWSHLKPDMDPPKP